MKPPRDSNRFSLAFLNGTSLTLFGGLAAVLFCWTVVVWFMVGNMSVGR